MKGVKARTTAFRHKRFWKKLFNHALPKRVISIEQQLIAYSKWEYKYESNSRI